ncbi:Tudor domain-containing protein [Schistosoma japonicum]|uniref:Tudor domain-containing protein n=1 Tax=Schistosoma japonicum TaxID=6182 RepID=A0A4Z2DPW1_SCHJA|nr:Tudor domain-containing protein [Schistosoma japonicum]
MAKFLKGTENRHIGSGAPTFVPFGSREASDLIQTEGKFLNQLRSDRERNQMKFDSFQMITQSRNDDQEESELQLLFNEHRKEVLAELKTSNNSHINNDSTINASDQHGIYFAHKPRRFQPGLSRFYELQSQKTMEYDEAIAKLLSLGYPFQAVNNALKANHGNYQAAIDYLLMTSTSTMNIDGTNNLSRGTIRSRGRGYERSHYRGRYNASDEYRMNSSDQFHSPIGIVDGDGVLMRPSTGLTRLDDLIVESKLTAPSSSSFPNILPKPCMLPVGCPILAQNISGDYEEAELIGHLSTKQFKTFNGSNVDGSGEKVVLVVYHHSKDMNNPDVITDQEEIVPINLIRTWNREKITIDMIPPAPLDRIYPYCGILSQSEYTDVKQYDNDDSGYTGRSFQSSSRSGRRVGVGNSRSRRVFNGRRNGGGGGGGRRPRGRSNHF